MFQWDRLIPRQKFSFAGGGKMKTLPVFCVVWVGLLFVSSRLEVASNELQVISEEIQQDDVPSPPIEGEALESSTEGEDWPNAPAPNPPSEKEETESDKRLKNMIIEINKKWDKVFVVTINGKEVKLIFMLLPQ